MDHFKKSAVTRRRGQHRPEPILRQNQDHRRIHRRPDQRRRDQCPVGHAVQQVRLDHRQSVRHHRHRSHQVQSGAARLLARPGHSDLEQQSVQAARQARRPLAHHWTRGQDQQDLLANSRSAVGAEESARSDQTAAAPHLLGALECVVGRPFAAGRCQAGVFEEVLR